MILNDALDDGIEAARIDYVKPRDTLKREGRSEVSRNVAGGSRRSVSECEH